MKKNIILGVLLLFFSMVLIAVPAHRRPRPVSQSFSVNSSLADITRWFSNAQGKSLMISDPEDAVGRSLRESPITWRITRSSFAKDIVVVRHVANDALHQEKRWERMRYMALGAGAATAVLSIAWAIKTYFSASTLDRTCS